MKVAKLRKLLVIFLSTILITGSQSAFGAIAKIGSPCISLDSYEKSGSTFLICVKKNSKKVWRKATTIEKSLILKELVREAADKAVADKAVADKAAADKAAADKAAADKAAADKAAADKAAADKAAADKAAAKVATPQFEGLPDEMTTGNSYLITVRGIANESCAIVISYPTGNSQNVPFSMSASGIAKISTKPGGAAGTLGMTVTCQKSGVSSARILVTPKSSVTPTTPTTPSSPATTAQRYTQVCIEGNVPSNLIKVGCQNTYPYWGIDLCFNRYNGLAFSLYLDDYTGANLRSFTTGQRMKSTGTDSPTLCPETNRPLHFTLADSIPTSVTYPSSFRANYRLVYAFISNGKVQRIEHQFSVTLK
jgi:hypothetical protein